MAGRALLNTSIMLSYTKLIQVQRLGRNHKKTLFTVDAALAKGWHVHRMKVLNGLFALP